MRPRNPRGRTAAYLLGLMLAAAGIATAPIPAAAASEKPSADKRKTESQLKALSSQIDKIRTQVNRDALERDRLSARLRSTELSAAEARAALDRLRADRAAGAERRAELARERALQDAALQESREALARQLRAAYVIGREEPLKLLLNQKDPARTGRMFAYYGYFGRLRAGQIDAIRTGLASIEELDAQLLAQDEQLASLEASQREELERLERSRQERRQVLASLESESRSRAQSLERLKRQQASLEKLLKELDRALRERKADDPAVDGSAFARLKGQLAWPVAGKLVARYGETRSGAVKWTGMLLATERGAPVQAVSRGRVVYADWLPGLGQLVIVDHGEGYLSLYAHNDELLKAAGEEVRAGERLARAGDSGGRNRPELYFEIRRAGKPVDPRPWFRSARPPG